MQTILAHWLQNMRQYLYLCLLTSSPERLIFHPQAFLLTILVYFSLAALLIDEEFGYGMIAAHLVVELALLALLARGALHMKGLMNRFAQTYSALVGINLIITPATVLIRSVLNIGADESGARAFYLFIAILIWNLAVMSLVLKRALEVSTPASAMLSFGYFVVYFIIVRSVF